MSKTIVEQLSDWKAWGSKDKTFDGLDVGDLIQIERMSIDKDTATYWMRIGQKTIDFTIDRRNQVTKWNINDGI